MKKLLPPLSFAALALLTLPSFAYLAGSISLDGVKLLMLVATIIWYALTPLWMEKKG